MDKKALPELNSSEIQVLEALDRKLMMEVESDEKMLKDCGWADFDGIRTAQTIDFEKLVAAELLDARPHPLYADETVYRLGKMGRQLVGIIEEFTDARAKLGYA